MTREDKELLLKDLSARLPYGVKMWFPSAFAPIVLDEFILSVARRRDEKFKPYLRPMSSMTEEEKKEYKSFFRIGEYTCGGSLYGEEYEYIDADSDDISQPTSLIDWLNAHYFDYRGLIEKGLALEAPEDMYKDR